MERYGVFFFSLFIIQTYLAVAGGIPVRIDTERVKSSFVEVVSYACVVHLICSMFDFIALFFPFIIFMVVNII